MKRIIFGVAVASVTLTGAAAQAGILKDLISDGAWNATTGFDRINGLYEPGIKTSLGITLIGDGNQIDQIGFIASFDFGGGAPNNHPDAGEFTIRAGFHSSTGAYQNDPFCWNPEQPGYFQEFGTSAIVNSNWQTVVGQSGGHNLYHIILDVSAFNWSTISGMEQVISLSIDDQQIMPGIVPYFMPTPSTQGTLDWWGTDLTGFGDPRPLIQYSPVQWSDNAAVSVTTVPAPAAGLMLLFGGLTAARRRRN